MKPARWQFGLPLLAKELIELSAKKRTYVLRCLYASLLFVIAYVQFDEVLISKSYDPFSVLGHGKKLFEQLVWLQFAGVYIFMPAMACGAITQEKERNSLALLLITRLSPITILFEKLLSRLIPMFTFLLLSLPLMAFAYSLGGVTQVALWGSMLLLALTCVQVATFALMCSSFCSTSISAFFSTYLGGLALMFVFGCCVSGLPGTGFASAMVMYAFFLVFSSCLFFAISLGFLVERALIPPRNFLLEFFKGLDRFFTTLNDRTTGGVILIKDSISLPKAEPIAWRETAKKSLGTARYLIRVFVSIEVPLLFILANAAGSGNSRYGVAEGLLYIVWVIAMLFVSVKTTSLIASERTQETLDVLMATPLTGTEIVVQKFRGVRRLILVMAVPFLTIFVFEAWWESSLLSMRSLNYLFCSVLSIVVYLPLVAWISFWIGLKVRSQARATLLALLVIFGWTFLPLILEFPLYSPMGLRQDRLIGPLIATFISPASIVFQNEARQAPFVIVVVNFAIYGLLLWFIFRSCTNRADEYLGRCGGRTDPLKPREQQFGVREVVEA